MMEFLMTVLSQIFQTIRYQNNFENQLTIIYWQSYWLSLMYQFFGILLDFYMVGQKWHNVLYANNFINY